MVFDRYYMPRSEVHDMAKRVHGLSRRSLSNNEPFNLLHFGEIVDILSSTDKPIIGHNIQFDIGVLVKQVLYMSDGTNNTVQKQIRTLESKNTICT